MTTLFDFLKLVLRVLPRLVWWVLAAALFTLLNFVLHEELWPNTPAARPFFGLLALGCLMAMPWLAALTAWRLAEAVHSSFWKAIWRCTALACYGSAGLALIGGLIGSGFAVADLVEKLSR